MVIYLRLGNKKIATVDENGKITAVGVGTSKITAKTYNGKTASCTVTVKKLADSITLNKTSITLGVGEKYDLNSSIPNNTAAYYRLYYSNNTAIAPVQKAGGLVTSNLHLQVLLFLINLQPLKSDRVKRLKLRSTITHTVIAVLGQAVIHMLQRLIQPEKSPLNLKEQQQSHTKPTTEKPHRAS